jgi:hypothetical protein
MRNARPLKLAAAKLPQYQVVRANEAYHAQLQQASSQFGDPANAVAALLESAALIRRFTCCWGSMPTALPMQK